MSESPNPRRRRWWLPLVMAAVVLTALFIWWSTQLSPMARLLASGAPVTFEDMFPPGAPADGNAAATLEAVFPQIEAMPNTVDVLASDAAVRPLTETETSEARELLDWASPIRQALDKAASESAYLPSVKADLQATLDRVQKLRRVSRLNSLRTRLAIADAQLESGVSAAIAGLKVAKHVGNEPTLTGRLVACAIQWVALRDALAVADALPVPVAEFDAAFAAIEDRSGFDRTLESERVFSIANFEQLPLPVRLWERPGVLRMFESAIEQASRVGSAEPVTLNPQGTMANLTHPALQASFEAEDRLVAVARCARIRLALRDAAADAATTADALGLPAETMFDPFGGEPLIVVRRDATPEHEAGWWVYSLGVNRLDDGGDFGEAADFGFAPPPTTSDTTAQ